MPMLLHGIALAAWMIVLGGSGPAGAQERVLVSNISQGDGGVGLGVSPIFILQRWNDHAQKFRTGNNSLGYRLSSVEIQFATFDTGFSYTVTIQQNNGGNPGGTVGTMSNPTASRFTSDRVLKFSAPQGGTLLQPNTDYFVVFTVGAKTGDSTPSVWWRITASDHEDSSGLTGWRIGNEHRLRIRNGSWQANALASALKLRLNGSVVLDTTAPTVTSIARQTPSGATTNADELTWRVAFSEAVANVDAADFRITGTTAVLTVTAVTGTSGTTYDVKASGGNLAGLDANVTLGFASAQNIEDTAGNGLSNTTPTGTNHNRYAMDNTAPTVAISGVPTTSTGAFTATFTFSEAVTGFAVGDITVANGVASGFAESTGGGIADNTVWTALITPSGRAVTVDVAAGVAQDAAGNGNSAAMQEGSTYTEPRVVVSPATLALAELDPDSGKKSYTVVLDTDPGADVTITVNNGDTSAVDVDTHSSMDSNQNTLIFTAGGDGTGSGVGNGNWGVAQTVTVQALNDGDAANETFNLTHSASAASGPYKGIRIDPVMVVMIDAGHGVMMSESMLSVAENGGMDTYTMALNSQPTALVRITVASGTTAATVSPATLTFTTANWNRTQTVTVTGIDDNVDQSGNRSATITHNATSSDPNYNNVAIPDATAIVVDNDNAGVTINEPDDSTSVDEAPGAGRTDSYTVVLDSQPTADVSIAVVSGTTTVATVSPATLTFTTTNWNRTQTVTVTGVDDNVDQSGNRNATITHNATSTDPDYNGIAIHHVTVTLVDNDMSDVAITESDGSTSVTEASGVGRTDSYMVALTSQPTANVRFVAAIPDGAAATVSPTALTFTSSNWNMAQTVTVTGVDDRVDQTGNRSATITHSTLSTDLKYNGLIIPSLTVTVEDNDTSELVVTEFGTPPDTLVTEESGAGNTDTYTVKLASQPSASVSIAITSSRTTVATVSPSSLTFSTSNWNTAQTVTVTGVDDRVDQTGNRNATIAHTATSTDSKYNSLSTNVIVTLVDNDTAGATIIQSSGSTSVNEASGPNRTDTYMAVLDTLPSASVEITVASDATGIATVSPATLTFTTSDWNTGQTVTVTGVDDHVDQSGNRSATITHTATSGDPKYNGVNIDDVIVTLLDDDTAAITINDSGGVSVNEASGAGRTDTYTVVLASQPTADVSIAVASGDTGAATVSPATLTFTTTNWNTAQTVTVTGVDDKVDQDGNRRATITHTAASSDPNYNTIDIDNVIAMVVDNDTAAVNMSQSGGSTSVNEASGAGRTDTYTVVLASQPTADVSIAVVSGTTVVATVSPATLTFTTTNWNTMQTVTVTGVDDRVDQDGNRRATITHTATSSDPNYNTIDIDNVIAMVVDNDTAAVNVSQSGGSTSVNEASGAGRTDTYTVVLASQPTAHVEIEIESGDTGAATVGPTILTFTPSNWNTAQTVTVTGVDDDVDQSNNRRVTISHTATSTDASYNNISIGAITVMVVNDDRTGVTVTPSDGSTLVTEALGPTNTDTYTVGLATQPTASVSIAVTSDRTEAATVRPATLTFTPFNWNTAQTVTVTGVDDGVDQRGDRSATISHTAISSDPKYNTIDIDDVTATVVDNDTEVSITGEAAVITEGEEASFTVTTTPPPPAGITISVNVIISDSGSFVSSGQTGNRVVTINEGGTATITVATEDDITPETDGRITATVGTGSGYRPHGNNGSASTTVEDNFDDAPALAPSTEMLTVTEGGAASYTIALDSQPMDDVTVTISVSSEEGVVPTPNFTSPGRSPLGGSNAMDGGAAISVYPTTLTFTPSNWDTAQRVTITLSENSDAVGAAITLTHTTSRGGHQGFTAHVLVMVEADDPVEKTAWHLRFGRTVSHQVVAALQERLTAPPTPGLQLTVAGEPVTNAPPLAEHEGLLSKILGFEAVTGEALVESSSLGFTPESEGAGPQLAFWGQGSLSSFSGKEEDLSLAGDITTLLLGADWTGQRWRAGAALTQSWGRGSYGGEGDSADGEINSILTGVFPYGRYALTPRLSIWSAAGYGWGQLSFQPDGEDEFTPSTTMAMTAAGLDGVLLDGGSEGITLISTADVLTLKAASATVDRLPSSEGTISRVRVGLEAARPFPLSHGASLLPSMEMGIRQDGGDAEAGYGLDLGAGIVWSDPERGISGEMKGRTLLIHAEEEFQEQGLALSFSWDPSPFNRGPSLSLSHTMGATPSGGMDALLNPTTMEGLDVTPSTGQQFEAELTYGFPAHNDRLTLTPAVALAFSPISRSYSLLWSLTSYSEQVQADPWQLSLTGERQEQKASMSPVEHSLKLIFSTLF